MRPSALLVGLVLLSACRTDADKPEGSFDGLVDETAEDSDGDGVPAGEDCDDGDASVSPDAAELCDGIDNNCDGQIDEGVTSTFFADVDGDGFGDAAAGAERCAPDAGEVANDDDCDDGDSDVFPGATEVCDGADQDCDGIADNGLLETYFVDADADGHGDPEAPVEACVPTDGLVASASDCDDTDPLVSPDAEEVCNEVDDDCDELVDEGVAELFYADTDGDGFGAVDASTEACAQPPGYAVVPGDCDDSDAAVSPAGTELCNGIDDNCDGTVDEDSAADAPSWYGDGDSDGYGDPGVVVAACVAPTGTVADATDCDDTDAAVSPAGTELCNSIDDNCDGTVDEVTAADAATWYADSDRDGYGDASTTSVACAAPSGTVADATDCDDTDAAVSPAGTELCNGVDDDCDGTTDEDSAADAATWYADSDADGYGDPSVTSVACTAPTGTVSDATDCDDIDGAVSPGATEVCNSIDDDCDGDVDDDDVGLDSSTATTWYVDADLDGYGVASSTVLACEDPGGVALDDGDCDDTDPAAYPGATEPCGASTDLDCDGSLPDTCTSCLDALESGGSTGDGLYTIDPDGSGGRGSVDTWCDMTTDGGGWTLVQRTVWDWSESSQLDTTQSQWHGTTYGDPSPGSAYRMAGAVWPDLQVEQEHMLVHVPRDASTGGDCSELYYTGTGGVYSTSSTSTTITAITASVTFANSTTMSTTDSGPSSVCPNSYDAVPWFYSSCCTTCPTFFGSYWSDEAHPMASYISSTADLFGNVDADVCGSGAAVSSSGYEGVNDMAYYLR